MVDRISAWKARDGTIQATREAAERRDCGFLLADTIYKHLMTTSRTAFLDNGKNALDRARETTSLLMPIAAEVATILSRYVEATKEKDTGNGD